MNYNYKNLIYSLLFLGFSSFFIQAQNTTPTSVLEMEVLSPGGELSLFDVASQLRKKIHVNIEGSAVPITKKVKLKEGVISLNELLNLLSNSLGYQYSVKGNELTFVDPDVRKLGKNYALDTVVNQFEVKDVTPEDAIDILAKKQMLALTVIKIGNHNSEKKVSLYLKNVTVREALTKIAREAGRSGWNSTAGFQKQDENGLHATIIISM
jgi:hypothetical protein